MLELVTKTSFAHWSLPTKVKQLMGFIGFVNYLRDIVSDMTTKLKALRMLTNDKGTSQVDAKVGVSLP